MKTILVDALHTFVIEGEGVYEPLHELLERYPNRKIILTNANDGEMGEFGLRGMPYEVFTMKHEPDKTDPKYFEAMLARFDLKADNVVYFEHNPDAVKSARSVGIRSHYYDAGKKDLAALQNFLDQNLQA